MKPLSDGLALFHGSYVKVAEPDLAKCAKFKDFGQGFYLTTSKEQARSFARISLRKAKENGVVCPDSEGGWVSQFTFLGNPSSLKVKVFESADEDWLRCVVAHRKEGAFPGLVEAHGQYDVVAGKIANDKTNITITGYMSGFFGSLESQEAAEECIRLLLPERLVDQYCFRSKRSLECLRYEGSERA